MRLAAPVSGGGLAISRGPRENQNTVRQGIEGLRGRLLGTLPAFDKFFDIFLILASRAFWGGKKMVPSPGQSGSYGKQKTFGREGRHSNFWEIFPSFFLGSQVELPQRPSPLSCVSLPLTLPPKTRMVLGVRKLCHESAANFFDATVFGTLFKKIPAATAFPLFF